MINIESPFEVGQEVYQVEQGEINKIKIRGAFEEPKADGTKNLVYIIVVKGRPLLTLASKTFETFELAKAERIKQEKEHVELATNELQKAKDLQDVAVLVPEFLETTENQKSNN